MLDFVSIREKYIKNNHRVIFPEFIVSDHNRDLMIKGKTFYAVWDDSTGFWTKNEKRVSEMIDHLIFSYLDEHPSDSQTELKLIKNFSSNKWIEWQKYCKSLPDNFHQLDTKVTFSNTKIKKEDYISKKLPYPIEEGPISSYEELISTLYAEEEREKLEWAIGSIISGDSKKIQKFIVLYGGPGTGKSTILNIIQDLFTGYYSIFDSKSLSSSNNSFALESFRENPLIAIQHDGDLSRIEDNTKLNSIVSHESMSVNEKFKSTYTSQFQSFLFMGTNKPVRITDANSGILRRLIDVHPTGERIPRDRFEYLLNQIKFELSGIAYHCLQVYKKRGYKYYDHYIPSFMFGATNDFYNFIEDNYDFFSDETEDGIPLKAAWTRYKEYCEEARVPYPLSMRLFKYELGNYFRDFYDRYNGNKRSVYVGFKKEKFQYQVKTDESSIPFDNEEEEDNTWLFLKECPSEFDDIFKDCKAQYATDDGKPKKAWDYVKDTLSKIDTRKVHYVMPPDHLIVVDFDLCNEKGEKDENINKEEAAKWPRTYAELSKSGGGIHLHYWYRGDVFELSRVVRPGIEIKVFTGKSTLRRKLTKCNDIPIATISSGLPLKEKRKMLTDTTIKSEITLRNMIKRNLNKEIHAYTKPSIDFIFKILNDAYDSGLHYDVTDMRPFIQAFALSSSHNVDYCMRLVSKMKFASEEPSENVESYKEDIPIVFFDVEIFPNLSVLVWKKQGPGNSFVKWINPTPQQIEELIRFRLVGFNNRNYDNHIVYAMLMGYTNEELYRLSQAIINNEQNAKFGEAYNLSYTDIYDFLSAQNKMSLKKWEIKLGIHHQELGLRWDEPVVKDLWQKVADYCTDDVFATEAVWDANQADWNARQILAEWAGMTVNDTTNSLTTRIIVGKDPNPQSKFIYTDLSTIFPSYEFDPYGIEPSRYLPGVKIVKGKSIYKGIDPGEGGRAIGYPGVYIDVAILDIASMHPSTMITLKIFGEEYTLRLKDIVMARIAIKHGDYKLAKQILPEKLHKYLDDPEKAAALADALKTAINSVYGLTSASFPNKLKDPRNIDNIVAKYGALFMIDLEEEVQKLGGIVVHIKTDSIKIANATPEIIQFVMDYGKKYGYTFEHEATYSRICLVNDAVFIAKYADASWCEQRYGYIPGKNKKKEGQWTATGTQFQIPYVFKTLFSKEPIEFSDLCETKSVTTALYLDFNEDLPDVSNLEKEVDILLKKGEVTDDKLRQLRLEIAKGHDYRFVGKVGSFCPMKDGFGAAILVREGNDEKMSAVVGTKKPKGGVYRWMEAEMVKTLGLEEAIDLSYYNILVDEAIATIEQFVNFEQFVSEAPMLECLMISKECDEELPFD